jgi:3-oxosteroid 1-dehydrogenase
VGDGIRDEVIAGADTPWATDVDVVVVGGGAAGFAAAASAASAGASVLLLERAETVGGTTAKAGGAVFWVPNNSLMRARGIEDPREDALNYMVRVAYPGRYLPGHSTRGITGAQHRLIETFYDEGAAAVDALTELGAIEPEIYDGISDYYADLPENRAPQGRALGPRDAGEWPAGRRLVEVLSGAAARLRVTVRCRSRVVGLVRDGHGTRGQPSRVVGVQVEGGRDGSSDVELVQARRGVVFASGGFLHDEDLRTDYLRGPVCGGCAAATNTGDFVRIGLDAGADLSNMGNAWWSQVPLAQLVESRVTARAMTFNFGDSMVFVNRFGRRVVNEKAPYNDRSQVHHHWDATRGEFSNQLLFMVYDDTVARSYETPYHRYPIPPNGENSDWVVSGDDFEQLANALNRHLRDLGELAGDVALDPNFATNLCATIEEFGRMAAAGEDWTFGRGASPIDRDVQAPVRYGGPNPTLHAFTSSGPYHAIVLAPGALDTKGGPRIDERAQVVSRSGAPIPGLFGAGNCIGSPSGEGYWAAGGTIGPALVFGWIAGQSATGSTRYQPGPCDVVSPPGVV